jgi:hypothetical protein
MKFNNFSIFTKSLWKISFENTFQEVREMKYLKKTTFENYGNLTISSKIS